MKIGLAFIGLLLFIGLATTFSRPPIDVVQRGARGLGMEQLYDAKAIKSASVNNVVPEPEAPTEPAGQPSSGNYANVKVLQTVDASEFLRLMSAITNWVAPEQGCTYCHSESDLSSDQLYTKVVARRMIQMVQEINSNWKSHVGSTGVTCYTCHRGQPVPSNIWFQDPSVQWTHGLAQGPIAKNAPSRLVGDASLPHDVFEPFLNKSGDIRVASTTALPYEDHKSIKQTEWTYGLMMHISQSLGVNCTFCHNSRSFFDWDQSTPQRSTAWYGIRMVRDLNVNYLEPLQSQFPKNRLGTMGDGPKVNCATCHQGAYKPLLGASMLKDYPDLGHPTIEAAATAPKQ
jgi:photosynthetic reaction center cytochrome c subunit